MTSPDGEIPNGQYDFPVNTGSSLPVGAAWYADQDESDWRSIIETPMRTSWNKAFEKMLLAPLSYLLAWILGGSPTDWDTLAEVQANLIPALMRLPIKILAQLLGLIPIVGQNIENTLTNYLAATANTAATASSAAAAAQTTANTAVTKVTDLASVVAAARATAAYTGNYNDMVTVPRVLLGPQVSGVTVATDSHSHTKGTLAANTSTGVISGSTDADSHAHSVTVAKGLPTFTPSVTKLTSPGTGKVYYTPIIADRQGNLDRFRFITGADSSLFSIDAYYVALMVYDIPAAKFRTLWNPGDIKGSMGSSLSEVSLAMGLTGAAAAISPGQVLIAAHSQTAPGLAQTPRSVAWVPQAGVARTSDVLLPGCYWVSNSNMNGIPSEVNVSDLTARNDGIPWYAVSVTNA